ncbi:tripartite tricarboxylate transporter substrate binding protein [Roseomonas stagni]|uniref:Tripartite tricarboxylate transporter substrate binding protein n=1 Tax=Falsiroseomonas algicola TaxID=2716930 RepID=A0A6M1LGN8_9PROT|nr:tripartite tricarboxylate transporter substrate-binding protein [Falsiroseomonas algicola]NGM19430.1 tripartite tricarboxylate transporter substrate binding protein [Falsiroseomonas algicola]
MRRRALIAAASLLATPRLAFAQGSWPERPVSLIVPFTPGGSTDIAARIIAERLAPKLGPNARLIIENRAGAGGSLGADVVKRANPDGYMLLVATASSHGTNPAALPQTTPYDALEDFSSIAILGGGPMVIVVPGRSRFRTIQDLIAAMRAEPGRLSFATSGAGGIGHLTGEYFMARAGGAGGSLRSQHIPYRGGAQVLAAMAAGEVDWSCEVLASATPHLRDNTSRGLAISGRTRHPLMPEIPTLAESGLADFDVTTWNMLLGPRNLPAPLVARLNEAVNATLAEPQVRDRMATAGVDAAAPNTPAEARAFLAAELAKFRDIVRVAGIALGR